MTDLEKVAELCRRLGAPGAQAERMAAQLLKRADQLAAERGISQVEAMEHLLRLTMKGARGEAPPGFEGGPPPEDVIRNREGRQT